MIGLSLCFLCVMALGCPGPGPSDPPQTRLSQDDAAGILKSDLNKLGYNVNVFVQDFDENGVADYGVEYVSGNEDSEVILLLAFISNSVGKINRSLTWRSGKVFVLIGDNLYFTTASDCQRCSTMLGSASDREIDNFANCVLDSWQVIEGEKQPDAGKAKKVEASPGDVWK